MALYRSLLRMSKPRVAVVGCGYWGLNLIRNFASSNEWELKAACDFDLAALARIKRRYPAVELRSRYEDIVSDSHIDAVVIATPIATHFPFARIALLAGKHVLVEKPMATCSTQALELTALAKKYKRTLMVDQTFVYTGAVRHIRSLIDEGALGELLYFDFVRCSPGLEQSDINVLWDLGPHDFSILNFLCDRDALSLSAEGVKHQGSVFENVVYVHSRFDGNLLAHFHFNWLAPMKVRRAIIGGSKKTVVYDDLEMNEKVKIYTNGARASQDPECRERLLTGYREGDMFAPNLETGEALGAVVADFARALVDASPPVCDGIAGYRSIRLLEAAQRSMALGGRSVDIAPSALTLQTSALPGPVLPRPPSINPSCV